MSRHFSAALQCFVEMRLPAILSVCSVSLSVSSNEAEISHGRASWQTRSFDKEFAAPVGWVGIEDCLRKCPRMSPWVEERALAFAIHVIRGFSENTSTGCLGASKEFRRSHVTRRVTECAPVLCSVEGAASACPPGLVTTMAPLLCKS